MGRALGGRIPWRWILGTVKYSDIAGDTHQSVFRLKIDRDSEESTPDGTVYEAMLDVVLIFRHASSG